MEKGEKWQESGDPEGGIVQQRKKGDDDEDKN